MSIPFLVKLRSVIPLLDVTVDVKGDSMLFARQIRRGSTVRILAEIRNTTTERPILLDPDTSIQVTILKPDKTTAVSLAAMTKVRTGIYEYLHTTILADVLGTWIAEVKAVHSGKTGLSLQEEVFDLVA